MPLPTAKVRDVGSCRQVGVMIVACTGGRHHHLRRMRLVRVVVVTKASKLSVCAAMNRRLLIDKAFGHAGGLRVWRRSGW